MDYSSSEEAIEKETLPVQERPPSPGLTKKGNKKKPSAKANAAHAREIRLKRIAERKEREVDELIAAREEKLREQKELAKKNKARKAKSSETHSEDDSEDTDSDVIVYEPVKKGRSKSTRASNHSFSNDVIMAELKELRALIHEQQVPQRRTVNKNQDDLLSHMSNKILNF